MSDDSLITIDIELGRMGEVFHSPYLYPQW